MSKGYNMTLNIEKYAVKILFLIQLRIKNGKKIIFNLFK